MSDNIFDQQVQPEDQDIDENEDWDEEDGWDDEDDDEENELYDYKVDPQGELFLQYGTETVALPIDQVEGRNLGQLFEAYAEDLMLTRELAHLNLRSGDRFVPADTVPEAGTVYVATVSVDSKG